MENFESMDDALFGNPESAAKQDNLQGTHDPDKHSEDMANKTEKEYQKKKDFAMEVMLCFWFALHVGDIKAIKYLYFQDPIISQIMKRLREKGRDDLLLYRRNKEEAARKRRMMENYSEGEDTPPPSQSENQSKEDFSDGSQKNDELFSNEIGDGISYNITSQTDLEEIQFLLQNSTNDFQQNTHGVDLGVAGIPFNTNVLRICLNDKEQMVAQVIIYKYEVAIDTDMIIRAI